MSEHDEPADAAARLERALERIARSARSPAPATGQTDTSEVAARLDGLIAELRAALGGTAGV